MKNTSLDQILKNRAFVSIATADKDGKPNAAPKFFLKYDNPHIYIIDYSFATTMDNLLVNPRACLSLMDGDSLEGYRVYGSVNLVREGAEHKKTAKELEKKTLALSADRVIKGARLGKRHEHFELEIPDKFILIKFKVKEISRIGAKGDFYRETKF